ncbi:hypothetical protein PV08_06153 [Exophiala spinifera]|uniref:N-acetyltransferase domain-containing protein n=1 Tax=Exophiala spinifera TaxID=91928 RepID=A0A0D1ZTJ9_9EURO|nr:uncharacterized protein PV08_06153 [Exophiala spinifera]KIW16102.1 hypothetical protein PV08_06153 [Exophiala spinifera]
MAFDVAAVVDADFDRMLKYTDETGGTLAAPLVLATWPTSSPDETARRNEWSIGQQRWQFHNDPTTRFMKVEDANTGEIVSLARWHRYSDGYPLEDKYTEIDVFAPPGSSPKFPQGLNGLLHAGLLEALLDRRPDYINRGVAWVLTTLVTRTDLRRRGAGGMLLQWGIEQAKKEGAPAYLEAVPAAMSTYSSHGFKHIEDLTINCRDWGMDADFVLAVMRKDP